MIVYADSRLRDTTLYPSGNSYTLFLQTPIRNITGVDLVSAKVPNTIYNLTTSSNVIQIKTDTVTSNVFMNAGFYSTCSLIDIFNCQVANVSLAYMDEQGKFIFTGNVLSLTTLTQEISEMVGLPLGKTNSVKTSTNPVYKSLYPSANAFITSTNIVSLEINDYIWLDIVEFRTSSTSDARKLILQPSGSYTTLSNTAARSFAIIPMDVASGNIKAFKEASDYPIKTEFPSRIDSLDRLTIQWIDKYGIPLNFRGRDFNSFTLRIHTTHVPIHPERIESLPAPIPYEHNRQTIVYGAIVSLVIGLLLILITGKRR